MNCLYSCLQVTMMSSESDMDGGEAGVDMDVMEGSGDTMALELDEEEVKAESPGHSLGKIYTLADKIRAIFHCLLLKIYRFFLKNMVKIPILGEYYSPVLDSRG